MAKKTTSVASSKMMHSTYFTLPMGSTPSNRDAFIAATQDYLSSSPGMLDFWAGELAQDIFRVGNDRAFNIAMNQVFENRAAFDRYNGADPRHDQFVVEVNRWAGGTGRRVYDSDIRTMIVNDNTPAPADGKTPPRLMHAIYFSLTDKSPKSVDNFIAICIKYLSNHPGVCVFTIGVLNDLGRDVSINNYDVAMNIVWRDKDDYIKGYLNSPEHAAFFPATQGMIQATYIFDSYIHELPAGTH